MRSVQKKSCCRAESRHNNHAKGTVCLSRGNFSNWRENVRPISHANIRNRRAFSCVQRLNHTRRELFAFTLNPAVDLLLCIYSRHKITRITAVTSALFMCSIFNICIWIVLVIGVPITAQKSLYKVERRKAFWMFQKNQSYPKDVLNIRKIHCVVYSVAW
jgi:hypothetical protein